ncbi:hypothetical protein ACTQXP_06715 [Holdemanella porci]|uniref:hypothetical protein n=1 Tax=Holdemanella porci TaxID=2652276 RepID=UPI003F93AA83
MGNDILFKYCQRNIVAKEWLKDYESLIEIIRQVSSQKHLSDKQYQSIETTAEDMWKFYVNIRENDGLIDWFKELVEAQTEEIAGFVGMYLKYYNEDKNRVFVDLLDDLKLDFIANEKEFIPNSIE